MKNYLEVTAAVIRRDGKVLIGKRRKDDYCGGQWEFPGGKIENGETPEECLKRELDEELGVDCTIGELFTETWHENRDGRIHLFSFLVHLIKGEPELREHDELLWVLPDDLLKFSFISGDIPIIEKICNSK